MRRLLPFALVACSLTVSADELTWQRVVVPDVQLGRLLVDGCRRSETLRQLVGRLEASGWYVFVLSGPCPVKAAESCLLHTVHTFNGLPYLRIKVQGARRHPDRVLALAGHELQHALEVAASLEVHDSASMLALFRRIGSVEVTTADGRMFETAAARRVERQVRRELRDVPASPPR